MLSTEIHLFVCNLSVETCEPFQLCHRYIAIATLALAFVLSLSGDPATGFHSLCIFNKQHNLRCFGNGLFGRRRRRLWRMLRNWRRRRRLFDKEISEKAPHLLKREKKW
jgi:hypothetical protein